MEQAFYRERLAERHGLDVLVPEDADRQIVHRVIYEELVAGRIEPRSREAYRGVLARLPSAVRKGSFWAVPRSCFWSDRKTARSLVRHNRAPCRRRDRTCHRLKR
jgi:hypothetical protein